MFCFPCSGVREALYLGDGIWGLGYLLQGANGGGLNERVVDSL